MKKRERQKKKEDPRGSSRKRKVNPSFASTRRSKSLRIKWEVFDEKDGSSHVIVS